MNETTITPKKASTIKAGDTFVKGVGITLRFFKVEAVIYDAAAAVYHVMHFTPVEESYYSKMMLTDLTITREQSLYIVTDAVAK